MKILCGFNLQNWPSKGILWTMVIKGSQCRLQWKNLAGPLIEPPSISIYLPLAPALAIWKIKHLWVSTHPKYLLKRWYFLYGHRHVEPNAGDLRDSNNALNNFFEYSKQRLGSIRPARGCIILKPSFPIHLTRSNPQMEWGNRRSWNKGDAYVKRP